MVLIEIGSKISNAIKRMRDATVINNEVCPLSLLSLT